MVKRHIGIRTDKYGHGDFEIGLGPPSFRSKICDTIGVRPTFNSRTASIIVLLFPVPGGYEMMDTRSEEQN
jgi:hypothetical protein